MEQFKVNEFIEVLLLDTKDEFFNQMKGTDNILCNVMFLEEQLDKHKSQFSMMQQSVIGDTNSIETNKQLILDSVNSFNKNGWVIIRYVTPGIYPVEDSSGRIIGWGSRTYN